MVFLKIKKRACIFLGIAILLCTALQDSYAAEDIKKENDGTLVKTYKYITKNLSDKGGIDEDITYKNEKYTLKSKDFKTEKLSVTEKVKSKDKSFEKIITRVIDGKKYTLKADENSLSWKVADEDIKISEQREYLSEEDVAKSIEKDGVTLKLDSVTRKSRREAFSAPAAFYSYKKDAKKYIFNGKEIEISNSPVWDGYEKDVAAYLNADSSYKITSAAFTTENTLLDDSLNRYIRYANFSGIRDVNYYSAEYIYSGKAKGQLATYEADIKYVSDDYYQITAEALYEKYSPFLKVIKVAAAILVIAFSVASIAIYILRKKKKGK